LPSLLGIAGCVNTRGHTLSTDIDSDNALTRGDEEECHAVNDLQPGRPRVDSPPMPEANHFPRVNHIQTRNQIPVWQHTRHSLYPSDPTPAVIKPDPDHRQQRQPSSTAIQSRANSADGDHPSSTDPNRDRDGDGGNCEVSCLVAGLYTRCSAVDSVGGCIYAGVRGFGELGLYCSVQCSALS